MVGRWNSFFSKPKKTMGMVYLPYLHFTFTIKISQMWANIPNMGNGPFQGRHSLNFRGPVSRIMLAPDNLRSRLWPRSFPRHHRSIPLPVNRGLGGAVSVWNFQGVFNQFLSFFGAKTFNFGVTISFGGLRILYDGASVGCWVILRMSRNTADQFIGLAWTCPSKKSRSVMVVWRFYSNILSLLLFIIFLGIYLNALLPRWYK